MFYSAKEIAELLGVSQTLVRQSIKELGIIYAKQSDGGRYRQITESDLAILFDYITRNWKVGRAEQKKDELAKQGIYLIRPAERTQEQPQHQQEQKESPADDSREQEIKLLNQQIELLNGIVADQKEQIIQLTRLLDQQQQLNLRTQKALETTVSDLETEKQKTWWQRLFKK